MTGMGPILLAASLAVPSASMARVVSEGTVAMTWPLTAVMMAIRKPTAHTGHQ